MTDSTLAVDVLVTQDQSVSVRVEDLYNSANISGDYGYSHIGSVESFAALRALVPESEGQQVLLKEYVAGSNLGGGVFIGHLTTATDDSGTVASGASYNWKRANLDGVTPEMFGAIGDGVTDDTTAMDMAIRSGYDVRLGPKSYVISAQVGDGVSSTVGSKITGAGAGKTTVICTAVAAKVAIGGWGCTVRDIHFTSTYAGIVTYLRIGDPSTNAASSNGCVVSGCTFGKTDTSGYAVSSIQLYNVWYSAITENYFRGIGGTVSSTVTYAIDAYYSVNITVSNNSGEYVGCFVNWRANTAPNSLLNNCEGWLITGNDIAAHRQFFKSSNGLAPQICNNIIDIVYGVAIESGSGRTQITDNWIVAATENVSSYFMYITGGSSSIQGNYINPQTSVATAIQFAGSPEHISIQGNIIQGSGTGISAANGSYYNITGNTFVSTSVRPFDMSATTYLTASSNQYRNPTAAPLYPTTGVDVHKRTWTTTTVTALTAGTAGQDFTVTLPAGLFSAIPMCHVTLASGNTPLVAYYQYDSSTVNTAVIRVQNPTGSAIPSSSYRFCLTFIDQAY